MVKVLGLLMLFALSASCFVPALAIAGDGLPGAGDLAPQPDGDVVTGVSIQLVLVSAVTTLVTYVLNYFGPAISTQAKGITMILTNAAMACVYQLLSSGTLGFNEETLVAIVTAIGSAAFLHGLLFKPTGLSTALGGGANSNGQPAVDKRWVGGG